MRTTMISAAVCAAFFVAPSIGSAESVGAPPLVLVKETAPTFSLEDFPWGLPEGRTEDVLVPMGNAVLKLPWIDVEKSGENSVIITAPGATISDDTKIDVHEAVKLTGIELLMRRQGEAMVTSGFAKTIAISSAEEDSPEISMDGFDFSLTASGYDLALEAMEARVDSESEEFVAAMRALNLALDYSVKSARLTATREEGAGTPVNMEFSGGPSDSSIQFGDGRLGLSVDGRNMAFLIDGPLSVEGEIGTISYGLSIPTEASKTEQPMQVFFDVRDVSLSDTIWELMDPKAIFPRDFENVALDATMDVILNESMFDQPGSKRSRDAVDPVGVQLTMFEIDGLGLDVSASGDVDVEGELPKSISAYMTVAGLSQFMKNVVEAGFLPQSQVILAEGIALQFAAEQDDGSLIFDVQTEDGIVTINGNRVAPLPR